MLPIDISNAHSKPGEMALFQNYREVGTSLEVVPREDFSRLFSGRQRGGRTRVRIKKPEKAMGPRMRSQVTAEADKKKAAMEIESDALFDGKRLHEIFPSRAGNLQVRNPRPKLTRARHPYTSPVPKSS
jgi:hypothetical protein